MELARYVVLNPVRAGMVNDCHEWPWSSYRAMIGAVSPPGWLQTDWLLGQFHPQRQRAQALFIDFVRAGVGLPSIWSGLRQQIYLGGDAFMARLQAGISAEQPLDEVPRLQRRPLAKPLVHYREEYRENPRLGMALAYRDGDYTLKAIAEAFGVHYTTVSRAVKEFEARASR